MIDFYFIVNSSYWITHNDMGKLYRAIKMATGNYLILSCDDGKESILLESDEQSVLDNLSEESWIKVESL